MSFYVPAPIGVAEAGTVEAVNKALSVAARALQRIDSNNFQSNSLTVVEFGALQRVAGVATQVKIGDDGELEPADYDGCLPYDDSTGAWEGLKDGSGRDTTCDGKAIELQLLRSWSALDSTELVWSGNTRRRFLHLRFTCQLTSNLMGDVGYQFAFRVDGRVIEEASQGGTPSPRDQYTGMHTVDGPVFIRALMPVDAGVHTVEVVYRAVYIPEVSENIADMQAHVLSRYFIVSEEGSP